MNRFLFLALLSASMSQVTAAEIDLDYARFDPLHRVPSVPTELAAQTSVEPTAMLVQFERPLKREEYTELSEKVTRVQGYIPDFAYLVLADPVQQQALGSWSLTRWTGPFHPAYKLSSTLGHGPEMRAAVTYFSGASAFFEGVASSGLGLATLDSGWVGDQFVAVLEGSCAQFEELAKRNSVQFIERAGEITARNNTIRGIVQTNTPGNEPFYALGLTGAGQVVGHLDTAVRSTHISFSDTNPIGPTHRKIVYYGTTLGASSHGTHTAGTAVGDAGAFNDLRGVAYQAKLATSPWPSFTDAASYAAFQTHRNNGARVHTNSWGDDGTTSYNALCRGVDRYMLDFEDDLVCFSVTNTSTLKNPENAKNLLAVGASQDTPNQGSHGSGGTGPTSDGRRKPEVYSPGVGTISASSSSNTGTASLTGTSMACPSVTGSAALIRQAFMEGRLGNGTVGSSSAFTPSGALIKAMLIGSTVDMTGVAGYPSNQEGWGRILIDNVLPKAGDTRSTQYRDVRNAAGLTTGSSSPMLIEVTSNAEPLKIVMSFTDQPATAATGTGNAAINDLNLTVLHPTLALYLGNVFASGQSITGGVADAKNNVEVVQFPNPSTGIFRINVTANAVNSGGTQGYALIAAGAVRRPTVSFQIALGDWSLALPSSLNVRIKDLTTLGGYSMDVLIEGDNVARALPDELTGSYSVSVKHSHWLRKTSGPLTFAMGSPNLGLWTLINGDVDEDNEIGPGDFGSLSSAFGSVDGDATWDANADLDGDGEVGPSDFGILSANFGLVGDE